MSDLLKCTVCGKEAEKPDHLEGGFVWAFYCAKCLYVEASAIKVMESSSEVEHPTLTRKGAGSRPASPDWRPMEKAPEEIGVEVLIWDERKFITIGELKDYGWDEASSGLSLEPMFWMPLPEPPSD